MAERIQAEVNRVVENRQADKRHWFVSLFLVTLLTGCGEKIRLELLPANTTVLAFGDSVTYGTGAARGEDYPSLLEETTGWTVVNAGIPGDTAREARDRLAPLLAQHQPALVIIELGGNDFLRKYSTESVKESLRDVVRQSLAAGAVTVLVAVPQFSLLRATAGALNDSAIYGELAKEEGVLLVADVFSDVLSQEGLRADPIHPNAAGYEQMTRDLVALFTQWGLLL